MMRYRKPWSSYEEQLDTLIRRGLQVGNRDQALDYLKRIGYYRLSGYWYPFRKRTGKCILLNAHGKGANKRKETTLAEDEFIAGATFKNAVDLYIFDKRLKLLVTDALERIEISLRVDISHTLGKLDRFAHLNSNLLHAQFSEALEPETGVSKHHKWVSKHAQLITRSKEEFVKHYREKYGLPLAIWVACEVWDFGTLSTLFSGMRTQEQDLISSKYGISNGRIFASWLRSLNYVRNVCAHHGRLWNRNIVEVPKLPPASDLNWVKHFESNNHAKTRSYLLLGMMGHLLQIVSPSSKWSSRMEELLESFPDLNHLELNVYSMGVPSNNFQWNQFFQK
ncbi:MAG TPA: Abi family protein [Polynucleobacter sp.]|nr:Abi family protein [Polynucleobacter sp.]HQT19709.1 Abi family protein [Polynucleobacter sp.]HQT40897.1 Abi family protein [Polynucleobacter sp.]